MKDNWMAEEEHWRGIRIVISDSQGTACLEALCSIATGTSPDCLGCFPFHEFCFWQILILFWWSSQYPHKPLSETFQLRPYKMWEKYKPVKCLEEIWGAQGCLNPSAVCIYSTQKDFSSSDDTTLGLLCSWLPADSSTINVLVPRYLRYTLFLHASWSSRAVLKKKEKTWILTFFQYKNLATVLTLHIPFSFASMYLATKWSGLIKGVTSPVQTLLVCYWSLSQQCHQNLFLTDPPIFAQNVVHALITPRLGYCRSFMVLLNLSLLNFEISSYSGEQSEHLPLPSFSWLSFIAQLKPKLSFGFSGGSCSSYNWSFKFLLMSLPTFLSPLCSPPPLSLLYLFVLKKK